MLSGIHFVASSWTEVTVSMKGVWLMLMHLLMLSVFVTFLIAVMLYLMEADICFGPWLKGHSPSWCASKSVAWDSSQLHEPEAGPAYKMKGSPHPSPCDPLP